MRKLLLIYITIYLLNRKGADSITFKHHYPFVYPKAPVMVSNMDIGWRHYSTFLLMSIDRTLQNIVNSRFILKITVPLLFLRTLSQHFRCYAGEFEYRVTQKSIKDRLSTDTLLSSRTVSKDCRSQAALLLMYEQVF